MRSSTILLAALVGLASAGMPKWPRKWSGTGTALYSAGVGPTGTGSPIDHTSGGIFPSGGYTQKPTGSGVKPTGSGVKPTGSGVKPTTGSGVGPTGTGHGGSPPPTQGPHTTTITKTSDVPSE